MNSFAATYHMPSSLNTFSPVFSGGTVKASGTKANATSSTTSSTSSSGSAGGIGSTFLSLLAEELQNQDPTSPMDSTAMVGQMISLSQLGQLVSINQTLSSATTTSTGKAVSATDSASAANSAAVAATNSGIAASLSPSAAGAATTQLPFDPNTMMPWNYGNANAAAASINPALNATTLGLTGATNNSIGGK